MVIVAVVSGIGIVGLLLRVLLRPAVKVVSCQQPERSRRRRR